MDKDEKLVWGKPTAGRNISQENSNESKKYKQP